MVNVPLNAPALCGVNVTFMVQLAPDASEVALAQVPATMAKFPVIVANGVPSTRVVPTPPLFVTVTVFEALVVFMFCAAYVSEEGLIEAIGEDAAAAESIADSVP